MENNTIHSVSMIKCTVEMYGLPPSVTKLNKLQVDLNQGAGLPELIATLRSKIPTLVGSVINVLKDKLLDNYAFIINGRFYLNDNEVKLQDGDRVVLVLLAMGG
jgi:hypothetical protein